MIQVEAASDVPTSVDTDAAFVLVTIITRAVVDRGPSGAAFSPNEQAGTADDREARNDCE